MNKKITAVMAVIIVLLMVLTGTFAWMQYNQHKTNEASGDGIKYDVSLIEDFQEIEYWQVAEDPIKKEIRVKNTGLVGTYGDVFVRLQLKEYMEIAPLTYEYSEYRFMTGDNGEFLKYDTATEAQAAYPGHTALPRQAFGDVQEHWYIRTQAGDINGQYGKFLVMDITTGTAESVVDGKLRATNTEAEHHSATNGECDYTVHEWTGTATSADCEKGFHTYIKWFLGENVISMAEWSNPGGAYKGRAVEAWIYDADSEEGWIYWGMPLAPGQETTNLLEQVKLIRQPRGDFYYAIHVDMEAVSSDEMWWRGGTEWDDAPKELIEVLTAPQ